MAFALARELLFVLGPAFVPAPLARLVPVAISACRTHNRIRVITVPCPTTAASMSKAFYDNSFSLAFCYDASDGGH